MSKACAWCEYQRAHLSDPCERNGLNRERVVRECVRYQADCRGGEFGLMMCDSWHAWRSSPTENPNVWLGSWRIAIFINSSSVSPNDIVPRTSLAFIVSECENEAAKPTVRYTSTSKRRLVPRLDMADIVALPRKKL
jgi:hypothetical protein